MANLNWGHLLFGFDGRINRAKFWLVSLLYGVVSLILYGLSLQVRDPMIVTVGMVVNLVVFVSGLAIGAKRLHDRNKSMAWLLVYYILPGVLIGVGLGLGIYGALHGETQTVTLGTVLMGIGGLFIAWGFVDLAILRGTVGPNRYGPDPLGSA